MLGAVIAEGTARGSRSVNSPKRFVFFILRPALQPICQTPPMRRSPSCAALAATGMRGSLGRAPRAWGRRFDAGDPRRIHRGGPCLVQRWATDPQTDADAGAMRAALREKIAAGEAALLGQASVSAMGGSPAEVFRRDRMPRACGDLSAEHPG
ncbi:MAG: hypothetical protein R3F11_19905 [Verrucomicrobiales bacterium]